jgi:hypothetical protein
MGKESLVMAILKDLNIGYSYNYDRYDGYVFNAIVFKKICKIRENANGYVFIEFPFGEYEPQTFKTVNDFAKYIRSGVIQ